MLTRRRSRARHIGASLPGAAAAQGAPDVLEQQETGSDGEHGQPHRQAYALVADSEIHVAMARGRVDQQRNDRYKGDEKKRDESSRNGDDQRLKPAKIAKGDAQQRSFTAGAFDVMGRAHSPVE